jgi:hypothetical protein
MTDPRGAGSGGKPRQPDAPESRRSTLRMPAVAAPASRPSGAESETYGRIFRMVSWLDINKGSFIIARLISQTGVNLRTFGLDTRDDPRVLTKLWPLFDLLLTEPERQALMKALREP